MTMKRKRRRSREAMERTELRREATRLLREVQYLQSSLERGVLNDTKKHCDLWNWMQHDALRVHWTLLCDFEDPQQPNTPEYRETQRGHGSHRHHDHLQDTAQHHEEVEAVEQRHEIGSRTQSIHLHKHLDDKQHQQHTTGNICRDERRESGWSQEENNLCENKESC